MNERIDPRTTDLSRRDFLSAAAGLTLALTVTPDPLAILGVESVRHRKGRGRAVAECLADDCDRRYDHHRLAGRRDGTRHVHHAAGGYRRRARRRLGNGQAVFPPEWNEKKFGNPGYDNYAFQTSASSRSTAISRRCASRAPRHGGSSSMRSRQDGVYRRESFRPSPASSCTRLTAAASPMARSRALPRRRPNCRKSKRRTSKPPASFRYIGKDFRGSKCRQSDGRGQIRNRCPGPGHGLRRSAAIALSGRRAADGGRAAGAQVKGVTDIVRLPEGVGVVGTSVEATQAAKSLLKVTWSDAPGAHHDSEKALEEFAAIGRDKSREGVPYESVGDAKAAMRGAAQVSPGRIPHPLFLPRPDGADERHCGRQPRRQVRRDLGRHPGPDRACTTRSPGSWRPSAAASRCISISLGGGFGRRSQQEVVIDAVRLAKAVGKPVKLIWRREDDMTAESSGR